MNKRSIAFQLGIYVLAAVIVVISLIVFINYEYSKKIIMDKIEESAINQSSTIINEITKKVVNNEEVVRNVASQALYYKSHGDLDFFIKQVVHNNPIVDGMHVMLLNKQDTIRFSVFHDADNQVVSKKNLEQCSLAKYPGLVKKTRQEKVAMWSDPFFCLRDSNQLMISYFSPIINQRGEVVGVISSDINLHFLSTFINHVKIRERGFAFIVSEDGFYLTHPNKDWVMKRNIFGISEKVFIGDRSKLRKMIVSGESGSGYAFPQLLNYEKSWFYFAPIPHTNWRVIIVIPASELFKELNLIIRDSIFVSAIGIILILFIILLIIRKTLYPLSEVVKSIQKFSFGDRGRKSKTNEIELLTESLKELQYQYGTYIKEQDQIRKDNRKYEKDLKSAKAIQRTIIPPEYSKITQRTEIDLHALLQPAESIGGDLYDYFFIDSNHLLFTMGDVSGKGIPAALFMAVAHTMIKSKATTLSAMHIVDVVNKELSRENSNQHFLTLFLGILDLETGILDYCNAAHNYPYLLKKNNEIIQLEQTHGLPIGVYSNKNYKSNTTVLSKDDVLLLYTDGVIDCRNEKGQFYGQGRFTKLLANVDVKSPRNMVNQVMDDLSHFKGKTKQTDDISLMAIKFNGKYQ
ncbi:MAG TPA: SpoIIE family protein phosphatase [Sunxiuqinia sp.]|nr:SpoIIE family protein phosphatase [Sunxiuqinia sp.]